jgi:molybdate transport system ATP-binding protein
LDDLPVRRDFGEERLRTLLELEMTGLEGRAVAQLSNGELRKLLLAAAHLANPRLLLLDDPMGGLSESARRKLSAALARWRRGGQTIVFSTTHDDELAFLAQKRFVLSHGALQLETAANREYYVCAPEKPKPSKDPRLEKAQPTFDRKESLRCESLSMRMNGIILLDGVSWSVMAGQHWLITGPNGSGKTTLLSLVFGDHPQSYANDIEELGCKPGPGSSLFERQRRIGYMAPDLAWHYPRAISLRELVLSGFDGTIGVHRLVSSVEAERVQTLLATFELLPGAEEPIASLSEGTLRTGLLLRAIVHEPELLLLDEPT